MSGQPVDVFSCVAKSKDGGQRFYEFREIAYEQLADKLIGDETCIRISNMPSGPITDVCVNKANDSQEVAAYVRSHGKHSQYRGFKPRWLVVNLRNRHVWSDFATSLDLIMEKVILTRGKINDQCWMIVDQSLGGNCVDYNMFPMSKNSTSAIDSNWSWWKNVEFIMKIWLLTQKDDAVVVYQILLDYNDHDCPARPTNFTFSVRFVSQDTKSKEFLNTLFWDVKTNSREQPANFSEFYKYAVERAYLANVLKKMKRLTWERLYLEDQDKNDVVRHITMEGSSASIKEQIESKWHSIGTVSKELYKRAAMKITKSDQNSSSQSESESSEDDTISHRQFPGAFDPKNFPKNGQFKRESSDSSRLLVISGVKFEGRKIKEKVEDFFTSSLSLSPKVKSALLMSKDKNQNGIVCVEFETIADRNKVMDKNDELRKVGSRIYFNEYKTKEEMRRSRSQPRRPTPGNQNLHF